MADKKSVDTRTITFTGEYLLSAAIACMRCLCDSFLNGCPLRPLVQPCLKVERSVTASSSSPIPGSTSPSRVPFLMILGMSVRPAASSDPIMLLRAFLVTSDPRRQSYRRAESTIFFPSQFACSQLRTPQSPVYARCLLNGPAFASRKSMEATQFSGLFKAI